MNEILYLVIPCYNEQEVLPETSKRLKEKLGGMIAAPQIVGLNDTILRTLRDEPGYWWETYRHTWKRNLKESLLPGAVCGLLLAMELFSLCHINIASGQVAVIAVLVALILLAGIDQ